MMILVTAATGHVGRAVVSLGQDAVAMVRDASGIALRVADYEDGTALKRLAGIDRA
jgi:uncharacterized protein YbjT (DUF2867 family)